MFGFSGGEILLIALIALILFGNDKLPENMKKMIRGLNQAKKVAKDVQSSWQDVKSDVQRSINFEDEKQEVQSLMSSASVQLDMDSPENYYSRQSDFSVPQDEIDDYQTHNFGQENTLNEDKGLLSHEDIKLSYISANDYIQSSQFVGPRV